jgi:hypothetical protein
MTDDSNARYRSNEPRTPDQNGHGSDPLAELARLIGQGDFLSQSREVPPPAPRAPQYYDEPAPHPADPAQHFADPQPQAEPAYEPRIEPAYVPEPSAHAAAASKDWPAFDPFAPASSQGAPDLPSQRSPRSEFVFPHSQHAAHADAGSYDEPSLRQDPAAIPFHLPSDHAASPPPLDEYYADAPQGGRRRGLLTVAAVFCLAVIGTAGAFGYRTWFGGPSVKSAPAVIKASTEPAKVAPPAAPSDPNSNKISYDRFGDRGQNEKVVLREEKPVDLKEATRSGAGMSSVPMPSQPAATPPAAASASNPPSVLTDPKKVRTVTIRPDAPDATATRQPMVAPPQPQPAAQTPAPAPARQTTVAAVAPSNAPLDLGNPSAPPPPQARAAAPRPSTPPPAVRPAPAAPSANAPLSLAPENSSAPAAAAPRPARLAAAPASGGGNGNYLVQVSSQRSEADAQAAFRSVQSRYSSVLGDRQMVIRRAELAGKGTYYRAMVGPFSSRDQAVQLCSSLKAAGGDCVVQSN